MQVRRWEGWETRLWVGRGEERGLRGSEGGEVEGGGQRVGRGKAWWWYFGGLEGVGSEDGWDWNGVDVELDEAVCRNFCERSATACFWACFCDRTQGWGTFLRGEARKDKSTFSGDNTIRPHVNHPMHLVH